MPMGSLLGVAREISCKELLGGAVARSRLSDAICPRHRHLPANTLLKLSRHGTYMGRKEGGKKERKRERKKER